MSSGFISGGTTDAPIERSDEWLAAQKEIEANAVRRAEQARQQDGKSLFETLEANKGNLDALLTPGPFYLAWTWADHAVVLPTI